MDISLRKSIRNGLITWAILAPISFFYGALYTEIYLVGESFTFYNVIIGLISAILITSIFFIPTFIISLMYFYFRERKKTQWQKYHNG